MYVASVRTIGKTVHQKKDSGQKGSAGKSTAMMGKKCSRVFCNTSGFRFGSAGDLLTRLTHHDLDVPLF
jgi:hypothetical protein